MGKFIDLTGQRFGRLVVVERGENKGNQPYWKCLCDCGNIKYISGASLKQGVTRSCGCLHKETAKLLGQKSKKYNPFEICGDYVTMYTLKGEPFYVDLEDFDKVKDICWYKDKYGYICGVDNVSGKNIKIHRLIMNCPDDMVVDHIHGEKTRNNNRKINSRLATKSQNGMNMKKKTTNSSGYVGIRWLSQNKKWGANIWFNNKNIYLGIFDNLDDAIKARKEAEEKYFGKYSYDNSQKIGGYNEVSTDRN